MIHHVQVYPILQQRIALLALAYSIALYISILSFSGFYFICCNDITITINIICQHLFVIVFLNLQYLGVDTR
jgi:hypothetical protein